MTTPFPKAELLRRAAGSAEVLAEVIAIARDTWQAEADALVALARTGDVEKVRMAAHALAGSMANFTDGEAVKAARAIEAMARQGRLEGAGSLAETVRREVGVLLGRL